MRILKSLRVGVVLGALLLPVVPCRASQAESADVVLYKAAFQAYQQGEYDAAAGKLRVLLQRFPDTPLRDVATFWLARSSFHAGDRGQAAEYMSTFCREYPDNPLRETAEQDLLLLAATCRQHAWEPVASAPDPPSSVPASDPALDAADPHAVADKSAYEALHSAELQRSEQQAQARLLANPEERRMAAERKIQQVRDALRKSEGKRQFREKQEEKPGVAGIL